MRSRLVVVLALALAGCPTPDPGKGLAELQPPLDYNMFVCQVQPTLIRRCSYLGCHGNALHGLRIYSPGKLRLNDDGTRKGRDSGLTSDEVELNFESASGLVYGASAAARMAPDPSQVLLLGKPLARRAGGAEHHGVAIFPVYPAKVPGDDPEWNALVSWVGGGTQPMPLDSDCKQIFMNLNLTPKTQ